MGAIYRTDRQVTVRVDGDEPSRCSLSGFIADNCEDRDVCRAVRNLGLGESTTFGGGAAPVVTVERVW